MKNYNEYRIEGNLVIGKSSNTDDEFFLDLCDFDKKNQRHLLERAYQ